MIDDDLRKLVLANLDEIFGEEEHRSTLLKALAPELNELPQIGATELLAALAETELSPEAQQQILDLAEPYQSLDTDDIVLALVELRAGNFQEADRLLDRALGCDLAPQVAGAVARARWLFHVSLPVFMR